MRIRIFGDGLDALILASSLTKNAMKFEWITTKPKPGGYFLGARNCVGEPIDIGMVLLEPNSFDVAEVALANFNGEEGHAARPYIREAYSLIEELSGKSVEVTIETKDENAKTFPDYFISDALEIFTSSNAQIESQLIASAKWLNNNPDWHPRNKHLSDGVLSKVGISSYYRRIYGDEFYQIFFKGYLEKLLGEKVDLLPANLHRKAWAPLYWPETILSYIKNEPRNEEIFQPRFTRPKQGSVARWIDQMFLTVTTSGLAEFTKVEKINPEKYENFESNKDFAFLEYSVFGNNSIKESQTGLTNFIEVKIVHICADQSQDKVTFLNDNKNGCFRFSTESTTSTSVGGVTFEYGDSISTVYDEELLISAMEMCQELGISPKCAGRIFKGKIFLNQPEKMKRPSGGHQIGNSFTFHNRTALNINDNIVRGACASLMTRTDMA